MACIHTTTQTGVYAEWDNKNLFMSSALVGAGGTVVATSKGVVYENHRAIL